MNPFWSVVARETSQVGDGPIILVDRFDDKCKMNKFLKNGSAYVYKRFTLRS